MVVDDGARGSELGAVLLDWAACRARKAGKSWLRLDVWKSNSALHQYYIDREFNLVRIDDTVTRQIHPGHAFNGPPQWSCASDLMGSKLKRRHAKC
jgi:hypothetical protein